MELVSIIIPVYNVEDYLRACLDSVLNQTYKNFEIILIDDGSTDKSPKICDEYAAKDKRVRVVHQPNKGASDARNNGMKLAQGEYWMFIDSDDVIHPKMIDVLFNIIIQNKGCKIACCNYKRVYDINNISFDSNEKDDKANKISLYDYMGYQYWEVIWAKLYHKSILTNIYFPVDRLHEDEFFTYKVLYQTTEIYYTDSVLYYYLYRTTSKSFSYTYKDSKDSCEAFIEQLEYFNKRNESLLSKRIIIALSYFYENLFGKNNKKIKTDDLKKLIISVVKKQDLSVFTRKEIFQVKRRLLFPKLCLALFKIKKTFIRDGIEK